MEILIILQGKTRHIPQIPTFSDPQSIKETNSEDIKTAKKQKVRKSHIYSRKINRFLLPS